MKTQIKRYRLVVSRTFPMTHPKKGESTRFVEKIENYTNKFGIRTAGGSKSHTIRSNYELWAKRMAEVQAGRAVIELFYWDGKPYKSKQVVFATLDKDSGCGVQELSFVSNKFNYPKVNWGLVCCWIDVAEISKNDGLSLEDFKAWFKGYDLSNPMAIIHFTKFRY